MSDPLTNFAIVLNSLSAGISLGMIVWILATSGTKNVRIIVLQITNILVQLLPFAYKVAPNTPFLYVILTLQSLLVLSIWLMNINILQIYSILDSRITPYKLKVLEISSYVLFTNSQVWFIWYLTDMNNASITLVSEISTIIWIVSGIIYDNTQSLYLATLILSTNSRRNQRLVTKKFESLIKVTLGMNVVDWVGIALYCYGSLSTDPALAAVMKSLAVAAIGFHSSGMAMVFYLLKVLAFAGKKIKKSKINTQVVVEMVDSKDEENEIQLTKTEKMATVLIEKDTALQN